MGRFENEQKGLSENILGGVTTSRLEKNAVQPIVCITNGKQMKTWKRQGFELTLRGMTSLVTRKRRRWKSDTMFRNDVEVHWDRYVAKLWKSCKQTRKTRWIIKPHLHSQSLRHVHTVSSMAAIFRFTVWEFLSKHLCRALCDFTTTREMKSVFSYWILLFPACPQPPLWVVWNARFVMDSSVSLLSVEDSHTTDGRATVFIH